MTAIQTDFAWWDAHMGKPYWRPGDPETRFGDWGYDCSGGTKEATLAAGITVLPTSSADVARWALATGRVYPCRNARTGKPGDMVIYDKFGKPVDSYGPRGHIAQIAADNIHTRESNGSHGVSIEDRGNFWVWGVDMSDFFGHAPAPPPILEDDMFRIIKGDQHADLWLTNWGEKRHVADPAEANAIIAAGVTNGAPQVTWPQAWVDNIPVTGELTTKQVVELVDDVVQNVLPHLPKAPAAK